MTEDLKEEKEVEIEDDDELVEEPQYVIAGRSLNSYETAEIDIEEISDVMWDNISGGVKRRSAGYSLYGYVNYSDWKDKVACSGTHDYGYNSMKIVIGKSWNKAEPYRTAYRALAKLAGPKPTPKPSKPKGFPPCTKRILQIVDEREKMTPITRGELRKTMQNEGYKISTIRIALKTMENDKRILLDGSSSSKNQKIMRNPK